MNFARLTNWAALAAVGLLACLACLTSGGCAHRVAVEGTSSQLYAEAKGALESEGFRPMGAKSHVFGAKGSCRAEGRLQFLYYADNIAPTVVEVLIEPGEAVAASAGPAAGAERASGGTDAVAARPAEVDRSHSVAISAWSSMTFAPDPWITDLAVQALRRAFLLSGNIR